MAPRRDHALQLARREMLVADELNVRDSDDWAFGHVESPDRRVVRSRRARERNLRVEVARILIDRLERLFRSLDPVTVEDCPRMKLDGVDHLVLGGLDVFHALEPHIGDEWPFGNPEDQNCLATGMLDFGADMVEKAHAVDRLDVLIDDRIVKRLAYARGNMERNRVVLDALVAVDADFRN